MDNNNTYFIILEQKNKPIKVAIEDNIKITCGGNVIEIKKHLTSKEAEMLLNDIFETTNIGILDCSNIKEDLYYCPTCQKFLELNEIDSCMNTPNEIIDYCLWCHSEVVNIKDDK